MQWALAVQKTNFELMHSPAQVPQPPILLSDFGKTDLNRSLRISKQLMKSSRAAC